jgi:virginiamycin A acetyltransferase
MKNFLRDKIRFFILGILPELREWISYKDELKFYVSNASEFKISDKAILYRPFKFFLSSIGDYSYIAPNASIKNTTIGKFCSIGPNFFCGHGIHPTNSISTSPMFYSTKKQNGFSITESDKTIETKNVTIGSDVFIGMNVTVLDGVSIGDGAVIGAGTVVSKDIPAYAIAVGNPIRIIKYRFEEKQIESLLKMKWWDWNDNDLHRIEKHFNDVDLFIDTFYLKS